VHALPNSAPPAQVTTASQHADQAQALQDTVRSLHSQLAAEQDLSEGRATSLETLRKDLQATLRWELQVVCCALSSHTCKFQSYTL